MPLDYVVGLKCVKKGDVRYKGEKREWQLDKEQAVVVVRVDAVEVRYATLRAHGRYIFRYLEAYRNIGAMHKLGVAEGEKDVAKGTSQPK